MKLARLALLLTAATGWDAAAQTWDNSGNGMLQGAYYFREVIYVIADSSGSLGRAIALYGNITFNTGGNYSMAVTVADSSTGLGTGSFSGAYSIAASGYGFITIPAALGGWNVYGLVSQQGIFVGSATEGGFNDIFIAAPLASPAPTNASFKGSYTLANFDPSAGSPTYTTSYQFQLNPDGAGNLGNVSANGFIGGGGSGVYTQTISNVKYSFSNGGCNLAFPNSTNATFISGQKFLYISPDGNFVFGGSPVSWDMFVGVRTGSATPSFGGLYYQAGIDQDDSALANGYGLLDTYYGSLSAGAGSILDHQRTLNPLLSAGAYHGTYSGSYTLKSDGTYTNGLMRYLVGAGVRIGSGIGPFLGLNVAVAAPSFSGSGVYLYPTGVLNAASFAPFTAGIAPGELLTLYGTNLAAGLQVSPAIPFPATLGGVQVTISGLPAPLYYVSPSQISAIVPYAVTGPIAQVQVINNGTASNTVSMFVNKTSPGVFTQNANGLGAGAVTHLDGSLVTPSHPAAIGETVSLYLTGLGAVNPLVPDGAAGPVSPLSQVTNSITVDINGVAATVGYAGLAPQLAGLYQINFTVPAGVTAGDNSLDIGGPDSYTSESLISVGPGATAAWAPESAAVRHRSPRSPAVRTAPQTPLPAEPRLHRTTMPASPLPGRGAAR